MQKYLLFDLLPLPHALERDREEEGKTASSLRASGIWNPLCVVIEECHSRLRKQDLGMIFFAVVVIVVVFAMREIGGFFYAKGKRDREKEAGILLKMPP